MQYNCNDNTNLYEIEDKKNIEGLIYDIQRYSIHDGPGIRTIVFLKGCPLKCLWCANPESQRPEVEFMGDEKVGKIVTVEYAMNIVKRDLPFFKRSDGGLTISGGEPLMQPLFTKALIEEAKAANINVAIETSGYQKWDVVKNVLEDVDIILYDIKTMNSTLHKELTGVSNELILQNISNLAKMNKQIVVRIPVIRDYNDNFENLSQTAMFCRDIGVKEIHLLPYHQLGVHKYKKLNRVYTLDNIKPNNKEKLISDAEKLQNEYGVLISVY